VKKFVAIAATIINTDRNLVSTYFQRFMPLISVPGPVEIDEVQRKS